MTAKTIAAYCVSHKKVDLYSSGISLVGVGGLDRADADYSDTDGDTISHLNDCFSELTGHYHVWKNCVPACQNSLVAFCHYRRFLVPAALAPWIKDRCSMPFDNRHKGGEGNYSSGFLIEMDDLQSMFQQCNYLHELQAACDGVDIVLPKRNALQSGGFIGQYSRSHPIEPFESMLEIISDKDSAMGISARYFFEKYPHAYWNNLFVTRFELFSAYCQFAFDVLLEVYGALADYASNYQNRVCAFLSERLLNFWIYYRNLTKKEIDWCVTSEIQKQPESHQIRVPV